MDSTRDSLAETERVFHALDAQFFGKYRGVVCDNADTTHRGRLQVKVPAVMGEEKVWAEPCAPYAGDGVGFFAMPPADTGVWVEFEAGDTRYPIWSGCFWADGQIAAADAAPSIKFFKTDSFTIRIDDDQGEMVIETKTGSRVTVNGTEVKLEATQVSQVAQTAKTELTPASFSVNDGALAVAVI